MLEIINMLRISARQMGMFREQAERSFEYRALRHLVGAYPTYVERVGLPGLRALVAESRQEAAMFGLNTEKGILTWAQLVIVYGPGFHKRDEWAQYIVHAFEIECAERVTRLRDYL
jgi:hypothetical protein